MKSSTDQLPVYSLHNFSSPERKEQQFQVEIFDANRHFSVKYPHRHDFFEVLYLAKGSGFHVIDSNNYEILPPCIFFMSPGQAHKLEFSQDVEGFIFIFNADFYLLNRRDQNTLIEFPFFYTIQQGNPPLLLENEEDILFFAKLFSQGVTEIKKENYSVEMLRSILDLILTTCASRYKIGDINKLQGRGHILLKRFYQLVAENYPKNFSRADYA